MNNNNEKTQVTYSNPRKEAIIENWPIGGSRRGPAHFWVESNKRGERVCRQTTGKPKKSTYAVGCWIVDGDDGRTYFIEAGKYGGLSVMSGDMLHSVEYTSGDDARLKELAAMLVSHSIWVNNNGGRII